MIARAVLHTAVGGALIAAAFAPLRAQASSIAARVRAAGTRTVTLTTRARSEVCGDGVSYARDGLDGRDQMFYNEYYGSDNAPIVPCVHGPLRIFVRVVDGVPSALRAIAGPPTTLADTVLDLGAVSTADAGTFLRELARSGEGRVAEQALLPVTLVDSTPRWEILTTAARDSTHLQRYRRRASVLLARGAAGTFGAAAWSEDPAAEQRRAAVSALATRRSRDPDPVPELIEIARANRYADARAAAVRQLGQTADPRAIDLFASLLGLAAH